MGTDHTGRGPCRAPVSYFDELNRISTPTPEEIAAGVTEKVKQLRAR